ncbi:ThiF family adenylyltransferase [Pseudooceanicola sp. LIPI14-2-Ac024]|uniref:ThiF family adenylyltransferase n=1 Tax=Pseudooceanicola sp. LIPI14-2-Ac024 TaxID=3344875 RepID=UPI0035D0F52D
MPADINLALTGDQHAHLTAFLFPGDGKEAVALLLCGRRDGERRHRLVVREIHEIPYGHCTRRTTNLVTWSPDYIDGILERAAAERLSVIKVHSHPSGYAAFSETDDVSDRQLLPMIRGWVEADVLHGSAVMLPDGQMFGRVYDGTGFQQIACISVAGDDLHFWYPRAGQGSVPSFAASHAQAFDEGTIERLQRLSVAVIGASGTGSPTVEQLVRLGVSEIVNVDHDVMEERNVNRILNSTMEDAAQARAKVDVIADAINRTGLGTRVIVMRKNLWAPEVVRAVAQCDVVFGCMDSIDGRYLLNAISAFYNIPYFDIGIRLVADGQGGITEVCGTVNYLRPGRSSLMSRGLFSMQDVAAAGLARNDPEAHARQVKDGYIRGSIGSRPAVISVNMFGASLAVNEFLARLHPFREEVNAEHAAVMFSLASMELISDPEEGICPLLIRSGGRGDQVPLLGLMELAERRQD